VKRDPTKLDAALAPYVRLARNIVERRMSDARAHAAADRLDEARARLDEMQDALGGSSGVIPRAREQFFVNAFRDQRRALPAHIVRDDVMPTPDGLEAAVEAKIGGRDFRYMLETTIEAARHELKTAANAALVCEKSVPGMGEAMLVGWEVRHREAIVRHVAGALSDSQVTLHNIVGELITKADLQ
jgi:hypothetical protein